MDGDFTTAVMMKTCGSRAMLLVSFNVGNKKSPYAYTNNKPVGMMNIICKFLSPVPVLSIDEC